MTKEAYFDSFWRVEPTKEFPSLLKKSPWKLPKKKSK
jgi:hypothetical protein